jgi:hypothetical protein
LEELGVEYISHPDHTLSVSHENRKAKLTGKYNEHDRFCDPFVFFGFAPALTEKLEFVTVRRPLPETWA